MKNDTANSDDDVLLSEHGICYKLMTDEHKVAACEVLTTTFTEGEPITIMLELIQHKGYRMAWSECSSHYSMKALVNNGGTVENAIKYATFAMPGGGDDSPPSYPFHDKVQDPHDTIHLVVFRFDS